MPEHVDPNTPVESTSETEGGQVVECTYTTMTGVKQFETMVAMDANGNFVVSYTLDFSSVDQDVLAARFNSSGVRDPNFSPAVSNSGGAVESRSSCVREGASSTRRRT